MYYNNKTSITTNPKFNININKVHINKSYNNDNADNDGVNKNANCFYVSFG